MASEESEFKGTDMSTDFDAVLAETVTVLRSLDMNVDVSLDEEIRFTEEAITVKTETNIEESLQGITQDLHQAFGVATTDVQLEFIVSNNNANKETEKTVGNVPTSQSFEMCESYASNLPSDNGDVGANWNYEAIVEPKTETEVFDNNASPDGSGPCGAVSSDNSEEQPIDRCVFDHVPQSVNVSVMVDSDTRISQDYERRVEDRFNMINRYCDTTYEPVTFNSPRKRWMVVPGTEFDYLDYVVCYNTVINSTEGVSYHWHFVTFGLSDIHGPPLGTSQLEVKSGLGFELTFRVKHDGQQTVPPVWPVEFLQRLASYICSNKARVEPGDFFMWGPCLDYQRPDSPIRHIIMTQDHAFPYLKTPTGSLKLLQVVGVTKEEVEIAQNWKGSSLLELFTQREALGGMELVTDMNRRNSIFESYPECQETVRDGVRRDGSDLTGVNARILWNAKPVFELDDRQLNLLCDTDRKEFERRFPGMGTATSEINSSKCFQINSEAFVDVLCDMTLLEREHDCLKVNLSQSMEVYKLKKPVPKVWTSVHLTMDIEALSLLPLVFRGRIDHNRHFTFKSHTSNDVITFVPENMPGAYANKKCRFAAEGRWLHICLSKGLRDEIVRNITDLMSDNTKLPFPKLLCYDNYQFAISVLHPEQAIFYKLF